MSTTRSRRPCRVILAAHPPSARFRLAAKSRFISYGLVCKRSRIRLCRYLKQLLFFSRHIRNGNPVLNGHNADVVETDTI